MNGEDRKPIIWNKINSQMIEKIIKTKGITRKHDIDKFMLPHIIFAPHFSPLNLCSHRNDNFFERKESAGRRRQRAQRAEQRAQRNSHWL
jgi:hypothetical protein